MCLYVLSSQLSIYRLEDQFGCSTSTIARIFEDEINKMSVAFNKPDCEFGIRPYTSDELDEWRTTFGDNILENCPYLIDGTYVETRRVGSEWKSKYWSHYKKKHALLFMVLTDRDGRIRMIRCARPTGTSEKRMLDTNMMPYLTSTGALPHGMRIVGDSAYASLNYCWCPYNTNEMAMAETSEYYRMKEENKFLSSKRVLIEHVFGRLKGDWCRLFNRWCFNLPLLVLSFEVAACLSNMLVINRARWSSHATETDSHGHLLCPAVSQLPFIDADESPAVDSDDEDEDSCSDEDEADEDNCSDEDEDDEDNFSDDQSGAESCEDEGEDETDSDSGSEMECDVRDEEVDDSEDMMDQ